MGAGLQVFDTDGMLLFNSDARIPRLIMYKQATATTGSFYIPQFEQPYGTPIAFAVGSSVALGVPSSDPVTIDGATVSWNFSQMGPGGIKFIFVGVY